MGLLLMQCPSDINGFIAVILLLSSSVTFCGMEAYFFRVYVLAFLFRNLKNLLYLHARTVFAYSAVCGM